MRDEQNVPSSFPTTFTRSKEPQKQVPDFGGSFHQRSRNGDGGGGSMAEHRRGAKDNAPTSKYTKSASNEPDGRGSNKRADNRIEESSGNRRKGRPDRPNSDLLDRHRDSGSSNSRGGISGGNPEAGLSRDSRFMTGNPSNFQNGDMEHKRTGPIKQTNTSGPPIREQPPKKNTPNNPGPKRRSGQGKGQGPRGSEKGHNMEQVWRPGDQCFALYWEDSKVGHD